MFPNLTVTCTECTKKKSLLDYFSRAFERMENFWQGSENRPIINKKIVPLIYSTADKIFDANFKEHDSVYASTKFELDTGFVSVTFFPYPNSMTSDGNKYPAFNLPVDVYYGKYVI